jgi:hypothetical protein
MKLPQLFKCCSAEHIDGDTKITVKSRCFEKPIVFNISSDLDPEELIKDLVMKMKPREPVVVAEV